MDPIDTLELAQNKRSGHWADLIVGGSAILIAVISLVIALRQSQIMEKQLAASVWPYLQFGTSNDDDGRPVIRLDIQNAGIGPARVHNVTLLYDRKPVRNTSELLDACCGDLRAGGKANLSNSTLHDVVLTANQTTHMLELRDLPQNARYWERLDREREKITLRTCYCSVLDQCWQFDSSDLSRIPVEHCPAAQPTDYQD